MESGPVEKHRILSSGALLTDRTKTIDRTTKSHYGGRTPAHSVGMPGPYNTNQHGLGIQCAIITKKKDEDSTKTTKINLQLG